MSKGKAFIILFIVVAIWLGLRSFTEPVPQADPERAAVSPAQRVGQRVQGALEQDAARHERLAPDSE